MNKPALSALAVAVVCATSCAHGRSEARPRPLNKATLTPASPAPAEPLPVVVLGRWTTKFSLRQRGRAHNVRTATEALHRAVIAPHGTFSFNQRVGRRTWRNGYRTAPVIRRGELVRGIGGGVCQVSSTLYRAAYEAGFPITEHHPHSRVSGYMAAGLDSMVAWPNADLVFENPFPFPVQIDAEVVDDRLSIQLTGRGHPYQVDVTRTERRGRRPQERVEYDPSLASGETRVVQRGRRGRRVYRRRSISDGRRSWVEEDQISYPPVDEIVHAGSAEPMLGRDS